MKDIIVIGGGGFTKEVIWLAQDCNRKVRGVLNDDESTHGTFIQGARVQGSIDKWFEYSAESDFIIAIGNPRTRNLVAKKMLNLGKPTFTSLIHPSVMFSNTVTIGHGAIVCAGSIITTDVNIGQHCILNLNVTIGHECNIGDFVTIAPMTAISGNVNLASRVEVGTSASIRQGLSIGNGSVLGMGGVLTKSIPAQVIFAGNPAKKLRDIPNE